MNLSSISAFRRAGRALQRRLGGAGNALPARPFAPPAGGGHAALLDSPPRRTPTAAEAPHPAALVAGPSAAEHAAVTAGDRAIAMGQPEKQHPRSRPDPRHLGVDGRANGTATVMDEARTAALAYVRAVPVIGSHHAGAGGWARHTGHALRFQSRGCWSAAFASPSPIIVGAQSRSGVRVRHGSRRCTPSIGRNRLRGRRPAVPDARTAALPKSSVILEVTRRSKTVALTAHRPAPSATPTRGRSSFPPAITGRRRRSRKSPLQFGGAPIGSRTLTLKPGEQQETYVHVPHARRASLEARLLTTDAFPDDDRAVLEVPAQSPLRVVVYSDEPDLLRPVLAASPRITPAVVRRPRRTPRMRRPTLSSSIVLRRRPRRTPVHALDRPARAALARSHVASVRSWCETDALEFRA